MQWAMYSMYVVESVRQLVCNCHCNERCISMYVVKCVPLSMRQQLGIARGTWHVSWSYWCSNIWRGRCVAANKAIYTGEDNHTWWMRGEAGSVRSKLTSSHQVWAFLIDYWRLNYHFDVTTRNMIPNWLTWKYCDEYSTSELFRRPNEPRYHIHHKEFGFMLIRRLSALT